MSRLVQNISANLLSNVWSTALSLLLTPLYISFLGVESYGLIGFYVSWIAILGILDTGISATAVRQLAWLAARPAERENIPSLLRSMEVVYWASIAMVGIGMLAAIWYVGAGWFQPRDISPEVVRDALMLMAVSLVAQVPSGLYAGGLMGLQRQVECAGLTAFFGSVRGIGAVVVLWMFRPDIRLFFVWQIVASALQTGVMRSSLWKSVRAVGHPARFSVRTLQSVRGFAGGMTVLTALSLVLTQADKMILSRRVSLEVFGLYVLAWTVASGLSRVATPLIQAFGPHFTELLSKGDEEALGRQVRMASRLMSALILPPAALMVLLPGPILMAWTRNPLIASGSAPLLAVLVTGTVLSASSYPALSILYSRNRLKPVLVVNLVTVAVLLPLLVVAVGLFGAIGAACCWALYGLIVYAAYQTFGLRDLPNAGLASSVLRDFVMPCAVAFIVAGMTWYCCRQVEGQVAIVGLLAAGLMTGWAATLLVCRDVLTILYDSFKWKTVVIR